MLAPAMACHRLCLVTPGLSGGGGEAGQGRCGVGRLAGTTGNGVDGRRYGRYGVGKPRGKVGMPLHGQASESAEIS